MQETTIATNRAFSGRLLNLDVLEVALTDGRRARREVIRHPGAVAVLARAPDGRYVFVRQFRKAVERELLEIVAGTLEPSEEPEACARREIREETGFEAGRIVKMGEAFAVPGYSSERIVFFYAELQPGGAADPDPDEQLDLVLLDEREVQALIANAQLYDMKTWAAWAMFQAGVLLKSAVEQA